jgi:hypothetical protein
MKRGEVGWSLWWVVSMVGSPVWIGFLILISIFSLIDAIWWKKTRAQTAAKDSDGIPWFAVVVVLGGLVKLFGFTLTLLFPLGLGLLFMLFLIPAISGKSLWRKKD